MRQLAMTTPYSRNHTHTIVIMILAVLTVGMSVPPDSALGAIPEHCLPLDAEADLPQHFLCHFPITKDTFINQEREGEAGDRTNRNYGAMTHLNLTTEYSGKTRRVLVEFDASSVPLDAEIVSAKLVMGELGLGPGGIREVTLQRLLRDDWVEGTGTGGISTGGVTWDAVSTDLTGTPDEAWYTSGARGGLELSADLISVQHTQFAQFVTGVDILDLVQDWHHERCSAFGLVLANPSTTISVGYFQSAEAQDSPGPQLVLEFQLPEQRVSPSVDLETTCLGSPIASARTMTFAVTSNASATPSYRYIAQFWNWHRRAQEDPEWVILDLETGSQQTITDLSGYALDKFGDGPNATPIRAENGRIFFSAAGNYIHYYDPWPCMPTSCPSACEEETIGTVTGQALLPEPDYQIFLSMVVGPDGLIYGATQSNTGKVAVVRIHPDSLETTIREDVFAPIGVSASGLTRSYYIQVDPPWAFVSVNHLEAEGKSRWDLIAVNMDSGEVRHLETARSWISLELRPKHLPDQGVFAQVNDVMPDGTATKRCWWLHCEAGTCTWPTECKDNPDTPPPSPLQTRFDGLTDDDYTQTCALPLGDKPAVEQAAIDKDGSFTIAWTAEDGSQQATTGHTNLVSLQPLESLVVLPTQQVLGNAAQYHGFFRYDPIADHLESLGRFPGISQPTYALADGGLYMTGYSSAKLLFYDPEAAWTPWKGGEPQATDNPQWLGKFRTEDNQLHYGYFLVPDGERLYVLGRRQPEPGSAVSYFNRTELDPEHQFVHALDYLPHLLPRGLAVLPHAVVVSGELRGADAPVQAELQVYPKELDDPPTSVPVQTGLRSTGRLYPGQSADTVIGLVNEVESPALYRLVCPPETACEVETFQPLDSLIDALVIRPCDGTYWAHETIMSGSNPRGRLSLVDPETFTLTPVGLIDRPLTHLQWDADGLYGIADTQLWRVPDLGPACE